MTVQGGNGAASTAPAARGCSARKPGLTQQIRFVVREAFLMESILGNVGFTADLNYFEGWLNQEQFC